MGEFANAPNAPLAEAALTVIDDGWNLSCHRCHSSKVVAAVVCGYGYMIVCNNSQYRLEGRVRTGSPCERVSCCALTG
jgi:hypothetical protein